MSNFADKGGPDKDLPDEQQLEEYLRGGSDVSRQYRQLGSADVPAELDRLVLRQAQEAVKARPARSRTWMRWTGPLALAASAVLVLSIVIESGVHEELHVAVPASAPVEMKMKQEAAEQPAEAQDKATADTPSDSTVVQIRPVSPQWAAEMNLEAPPAPISMPSVVQEQAPQPTVPEPRNPQFTSSPPAAAFVEPPPKVTPPPEEVQVRGVRNAAPAPAQASVSAPVDTLEQDDTELKDVLVTGMRRAEQKPTAGPRNTIAAPTSAELGRDAAKQVEEPRSALDPEQWLRDIRDLRKENKHEAADREWRRFRSVYPNYEVDEKDPARGAQR